MNREVENNGLSMAATDMPFELAAVNNETDYDYYLTAESTNVSQHITNATAEKIKWFMNDVTVSEENDGLHPGSHGTFTFKLYTSQDDLTVSFTVRSSAYRYVTDNYGNVLKDANNKDRIELIGSNEAVSKYLKGHLLFFEAYDNSTGYYSKRISDYFTYDLMNWRAVLVKLLKNLIQMFLMLVSFLSISRKQ